MQDHQCNFSTRKQSISPSVIQTNLEEMLELLLNSYDIQVLTRILSTLGIYLLSSETYNNSIIKCNTLYDKIVLVLNSGLQDKTTVALNFICALLYLNDGGQTRKTSLHIYSQNMLRISGCLTAMINLFISFMLHQDTLKALCRSISEACCNSTSNQTYCSHLIPLCIRRCRGESSDMFMVLQNLLSSHNRNVKLFYESDGMTIFTRESLQHPFCLQLLNTVVENTKNENINVLLKSSHLFEHLRYILHKYGASNSTGQWVTIILFSHQKVLSRNEGEKNTCINDIKEIETDNYSSNVVSDNKLYETNELFRNVLKEVIGLQNADYKSYKNTRQINNNITNFSKDIYHITFDTKDEEKNILKENIEYSRNEPGVSKVNNLSFSFLLKACPTRKRIKDQKIKSQTSRYVSNPTTKKYGNKNSTVLSGCDQTAQNFTKYFDKISITTLTEEEDKDATFYFAPAFVSTPKKSRKTLRTGSISQSTRQSFLGSTISKKKCDIKTSIGEKKNIKRVVKNKRVQNKTIGAKFFDIINGSCTTLVKSFTSFKNIFRGKESSTCKGASIDTSCTDKVKSTLCNNSFTNYMRNRDALSYNFYKDKDETLFKNGLRIENDILDSCNTCNDTIVLKQKLTNDATLQRTVKRLIFGINLYGCNFKKISRTMWPNERYMTPNVLYNLYRKLIIK